MNMELAKTFRFEAAHHLPNVPADHKCRRVHGHSFRVVVRVRGPVDPHTGWVMDYADIAAAFGPVHAALDHRHLNDVAGLSNPTSELLAAWIWERLLPALPGLWSITVRVAGPVDPHTGWLVDYADLAAAFEPIRLRLDHYDLNTIEGLENPTSEHVARWIWERLRPALPSLASITVHETCTSSCTYRGD